MPGHDEELKRFLKKPPEPPDKEFDDAFDFFALKDDLKEAIHGSEGTKKERLQEQYIEALEDNNKSLEKNLLEAKSRVPSLQDGTPLTEAQKDAPLVDETRGLENAAPDPDNETTQDRYERWLARCDELRGAHSNNLTSIANQIAKEDLGVDRMTPEAESKASTIRRRLTKIQKYGPNS